MAKVNIEEYRVIALAALEELRKVIQESETAKEIIDKHLDAIEDFAKRTHNKIDDIALLPACGIIRLALGVEDNDLN